MKIFVTGATGFLGHAISLRLKELGHEVTVQGRKSDLCNELRKQGFTVIQADDSDKTAIEKACAGQDVVVNCAGLAKTFGRPADYYAANVDFVNTLISGCIKHHSKLIQISSPSVYCDYTDLHNISEDHALPKNFANDYAESKYMADELIKKAQSECGLRAITFRPHLVFGPGDQKVLSKVIEVHKKNPLPLFKQGKVLIDITYIDNFVDAVILGVENDKGLGKIFNIVNDEPQELINLLQELFKQLGTPLKTTSVPISFDILKHVLAFIEIAAKKVLHPLGYDPNPFYNKYSVGVFATDFTLNINEAKKILGYQPKVSTKEGIKRFATWYKEKDPDMQKKTIKETNKKSSWSLSKKTVATGIGLSALCAIGYGIFSKKNNNTSLDVAPNLTSFRPK